MRILFLFFKTGFHYVALDVLELFRPGIKLERFVCFILPSAKIKSMHYYIWLIYISYIFLKKKSSLIILETGARYCKLKSRETFPYVSVLVLAAITNYDRLEAYK